MVRAIARAIAIVVAVGGCGGASFEAAEPEPRGLGSVSAPLAGGSGTVAAEVPTEDADRYVQFLSQSLEQYARYTRGEKRLSIERSERSPATGAWHATRTVYTTDYRLEFVAARTTEEVYVFGLDRDGRDVVERWRLTPPNGAWTITRGAALTPIGIDHLEAAPSVLSARGGAWTSPLQRPGGSEARERIYTGSAFGGVMYAAVDPDGRFLLVLDGDAGSLSRLELPDAPGQADDPTVVYEASSLPELGYMGCLAPRQEATMGRVYVMTTAGSDTPVTVDARLILVDVGNDGVFDGYLQVSQEEYRDAGYQWTETFLGPTR